MAIFFLSFLFYLFPFLPFPTLIYIIKLILVQYEFWILTSILEIYMLWIY